MRYVLITCFALVLCAVPYRSAQAQEVAPFRLTDLWAYLEYKYRVDQINNKSTGVETDVDDTRNQLELGISTTSYFFHPKLLQMRLGGSLLSDRQNVAREQIPLPPAVGEISRTSRDDLLLNLDLSLHFLKDKPYPATFSYIRENPIVSTGLEGSFTQDTERIGFDFQLTEILPMDITLNALKDSSFGESLDRVVDYSTERVTVRAKKSYSPGNRLSVDLETSTQESRNGDPRRPIQEVIRNADRVALTSTSRFGSGRQYRFDQTATYNRRDQPDVTDITYAPRLRWEHSEAWESRYQYRFAQTERPESDFKNRSEGFDMSLHYAPSDAFNGFLRADFDRSDEKDRLSQSARGASARAHFKRDIGGGELNVTMNLGYRLDDRVSTSPRIRIEEEAVTFVGTAPVPLSRDFVVAETVVVRNFTGTQIYIEGVDYLLTELGTVTRLERIINGSILDGETVLVDYEAETGGTFEYSEVDQGLSADFRFARFHHLFLRYYNTRQNLKSGISTLPFNSIEAIEFGLRERIPLRWGGVQLFGEASYLRQDEDINPFYQTGLTFSVQAPLSQKVKLNASVSRDLVEYRFSDEDSDLTAFNANITWQALSTLSIRAEGSYDEDVGGTILRSNTRWRVDAQWRYRKISLRLDARYAQQQQGELDNDHFEFWIQLRRELF